MAKKIELKIVKLGNDKEAADFDYKKMITMVISTPPPPPASGFSLEDVRMSNKINKALEGIKGVEKSIILEDNEWKYLRDKVADHRWGMPHPEIEIFSDLILQAETTDLNK